MGVAASTDQGFDFVRQLARELEAGDVRLPSFPAVIVKIRDMLEDEEVDFDQLSEVVSADAALVSRLFVFANSSYHNRTGENVSSLPAAISRLGLGLVRNTALSLAIKQLVFSENHNELADYLKRLWVRSVRLASLSHAVASYAPRVENETAFLTGLLHEIGMLYILSKSKQYPDFLGDRQSLERVLDEWHSQVGRSIVESWGFPDEVVHTMVPTEFIDEHTHLEPALVDVIYVASLLQRMEEAQWADLSQDPVVRKFNLSESNWETLGQLFRDKLETVQQSLS